MSKLIYVADDEKEIRELIQSFLEEEGFNVKAFENGDLLLAEYEKIPADLVILDVMMPGTDGFSVCAGIRKRHEVPIILLTARGTDADYITGFTMGCDDYFTKPFSPVKLVMRVKAMFKRMSAEKQEKKVDDTICCGDVIISPTSMVVKCKDREIKLTNTELSLLTYMVENKGKAISREEMLTNVWGYESEVETRVTDDTIKRLRRKLHECESNVAIETIWGFGFKIGIRDEEEQD